MQGFESNQLSTTSTTHMSYLKCASSLHDDSCREQRLPVRMDHRRRQAALSFLHNISLNGQPVDDHRIFNKTKDGESNTRPHIASGETENTKSKQEFGSQTGSSVSQPALMRERCVSDLKQTPQQGVSQENESSAVISREIYSKSSSSVSRPRTSRRVHFIKNMRQHDTRNGRIVLISVRRSLFGMFSVLPYRDLGQITDDRSDSSCQKSLTGASLIGVDAVELDTKGKTVSYKLLYHTNALSGNSADVPAQHSGSHDALSQTGIKRGIKRKDTGVYDPNLLDDPQWPCGKHKRVLVFPSYMTTVVEYVKPSDLKKDMNQTFSEKFPHVHLTLSKIRSLKREIRKLAQEDCGYEEPTVAMAFVYFEKLAQRGELDKQNRKLCAGACILLAAKISNDLKRPEVKHLIDRLEERLRLNRRELLALEFPVLVALEFKLHLPRHEILPHYKRLMKTT